MYESMSPQEQELFDVLEDEIEQLRQMLFKRDKQAAKKVNKLITPRADKRCTTFV